MFYALRNFFALVGVAALVVCIYAAIQFEPMIKTFQSFDEKAKDTYLDMAAVLMETGNAAEATVWKVAVEEGLSVEDVDETIKFVANEHNIKNVGELPLSSQIEAMTGESHRYLKIYMFCNALTAASMLEYNDAYSAYLPCRISLVEDKQGQLNLYSLNMDAMIHGGLPLPSELKEEAENVKKIILDIMNRGAAGDF
jgi:uncharacterized protein (DUF302 family)